MKSPPERRPLIGRTILHYQVLERLGAGGMGEVYLARDVKLGRKVALKVLSTKMAPDSEFLRRFEREARMLAALNHPHIVTLHSVDEADGVRFLTMELVEGQTLTELIPPDGMNLTRFLELAVPLSEALSAAHQRGIVHRDLKPANIMWSHDGRLKVLDFGVARRHAKSGQPADEKLTGEGSLLGTFPYMSPEQLQGRPVDTRSDVFSLGVVFYQMLTGKCPFRGKSRADVIAAILKDTPRPVAEFKAEFGHLVWHLIQGCLVKDARYRYPSATEVCDELAAIAADGQESSSKGASRSLFQARLFQARTWPLPKLPEQPYPVLLPYRHPALLAGRATELATLRRLLRMPTAILGLYGTSGVGKSSLLHAGLVATLRAEGQPVSIVRHPQEPGLAGRLLSDLLLEPTETLPGSHDTGPFTHQVFVERLLQVRRLTGSPPILVLDQFESLLSAPDGEPLSSSLKAARTAVGLLLAATAARQPGLQGPPCRWILAYREEFHGGAVRWLRDVRGDEETGLPRDLSGPGRFHCLVVPPLGTSSSGVDGAAEAARAFQAAIEAPLVLTTRDGKPRYPHSFSDDGAKRLASAFGEARARRPEAPLTPELQVVLAHLLKRAEATATQANQPITIEVPENPGQLIDDALEDHLRRALEAVFPGNEPGTEQRTRRARALLALYEIATRAAERPVGLSVTQLGRAIGEDGEEILRQLALPQTRLVVRREAEDGWRYVLSHDRMVEVVRQVVEQQDHFGWLKVDEELLGLRRVVAVASALHDPRGSTEATRFDRDQFRRIAANASALLWDDDQRVWWAACRRQRRVDQMRAAARTTSALLSLILVMAVIVGWTRHRAMHRERLEQLAKGAPEAAFLALDRLATSPRADHEELRAAWRLRERPSDVLGEGLDGVQPEKRSAAVLRAVEIILPLMEQSQTTEDPVWIAELVWALDVAPGREQIWADEARVLRDEVLLPLRRRHPAPAPPGPEDTDWANIPAGSFLMGAEQGKEFENAQPRHEVTLLPFRILRHEVTLGEYRRLVPEYPAAWEGAGDDVPLQGISWYESYTYAAWLGGRLPTEAEWEYAARAGCRYIYCTHEGLETTADTVAWTLDNGIDLASGDLPLRPVESLEPNPWGLYDMLGSVWEWTTDCHREYDAKPRHNPWVPTCTTGERVFRGGGIMTKSYVSRVENRAMASPGNNFGITARPVLPMPPL